MRGHEMRALRSLLGVAIMVAAVKLMGPALRLTDDLALRIIMLPFFLAVVGLGVALIWSNK